MATILIVDDRPVNREVLATLLGYRGHRLIEASDGQEALARARAERPDLMITDVLMPSMDGFELVRRLREDRAVARIPVIFCTAHYLERESRALAASCGVRQILLKPVDPEEVLRTVEEALSGPPAAAPAPSPPEVFDREHLHIVTDKLAEKANDLRIANLRLSALIDLAHQLASEADPLRILEGFCRAGRDIIGCRLSALGILEEGEGAVRHFFCSGSLPGDTGTAQPRRIASGVLRELVLGKAPIRLHDLDEAGRSAAGLPDFCSEAQSVLAVPITTPGAAYGWICLVDKLGLREFGVEDERIAATLAAQVAVTYENARRLSEIRDHAARLLAESRERQRAEESLRLTHDTLCVLVDASPVAIAAFDAEAKITTWNRTAETMFGYRCEEVLGREAPIIPKEQEAAAAALRASVLRGEPVRTAEVVRRRKDGSPIEVSLSAAPLFDATGRVRGGIVTFADISEKRSLEEQVRQSQKLEAIGRLAGGIAHDFNNLLTVIGGSTELILLRLPQDSPFRRHLEEVDRCARRAATLTRQLLAFSRKQILEPKVLDPNQIVRGIEKMLGRLIGEDIELSLSLSDDVGRVRVDPGQMDQVFMNLAVNSRDAMPSGGRLTIETRAVTLDESYAGQHVSVRPGRYVLLSVSDTGVGMDAATRARVFEPFFTTKEQGQGTGLGLSTVYGIVKQSGGYIWVYSEPGHGTTFKIYLPRVLEPASVAPESHPGAGIAGSGTILLVEDEPQVRDITRMMLERAGYSVIEAPGGPEALAICEKRRGGIDLMLTDVIMPKMNGRELAEQAAAILPGIKVLYMSGYTDDAIVRLGMLETGLFFINKPFSQDALTRKVREVLERPAPGSAGAAGPKRPGSRRAGSRG